MTNYKLYSFNLYKTAIIGNKDEFVQVGAIENEAEFTLLHQQLITDPDYFLTVQ